MGASKADAGIFVSSSLVAQLLSYPASLGIDQGEILGSVGIDRSLLTEPEARIQVELYLRIEAEAARRTGDPAFGLHVGEFAVAGSWSILGHMMMSSRTLAQAFEMSAKYCRIVGNLVVGRARFRGGRIELSLEAQAGSPSLSRHCFECTLSSLVSLMRSLTGAAVSPLEVRISYPEPDSELRREYERVFRCPVVFDADETGMVLDKSIGEVPILYANPVLLGRIEGYAREFLASLEARDAATRVATKCILAKLAGDSLSIESVARDMAMSVRTLQARLEAEGRRFSELVAELRRSLAERYLREGLSVDEITCLLGFAEPSVFRKAFKKWTGITPGEFRSREAVAGR